MPSRLNAPVLTLDAAKMNSVDPRNVESLFGMWTVFNKCSQNIKGGRRYENMSWRIWARETLCCPPQPEKTIIPAMDIPCGQQSEVPSLSNSYGSDNSSSEEEDATPQQHVPRRRSRPSSDDDDSALSKSRGKEPHLTPTVLEKIMVQIQEVSDVGPLSPSIEASIPALPVEPEKITPMVEEEHPEDKQLQNSTESCISGTTITTSSTNATRKSDHRSSDTSVSSDGLIRSGSVVHGFSPVSTSFKHKSLTGLPVPSSSLAMSPAKKSNMFQLGASSEDDESSIEARPSALKPPPVRSSLSQSVSRKQITNGMQKKTTSFRDIVEQRRLDSDAEADEGAIASDSEEEDDSVFDEEEEDWEDSPSDDGKSNPPLPTTFRRVESRPDLVSRPSMLSMQIEQRRRASSGLANEISHSQPALRRPRVSTPNGPSMPGSPEDHDESEGLMMRGARSTNTINTSQPRPIAITAPDSSKSMAHSPRTTRRNMLSTELTESLRKNLLWERQQKSQTVNAFLKRSRNAMSMANLQTAALQPPKEPEHKSNNSWGQEFENPWEYNSKGW